MSCRLCTPASSSSSSASDEDEASEAPSSDSDSSPGEGPGGNNAQISNSRASSSNSRSQEGDRNLPQRPRTWRLEQQNLARLDESGDADDREDLLESGSASSPENQETDAQVVRQHMDEMLMQSFGCWILTFWIIICISTLVLIGLLIWVFVEEVAHARIECDVPIDTWVHVVAICVVVPFICPRGSSLERCICLWSPDPNSPQRVPLRVQVYHCSLVVFVFIWNCVGVYWIFKSGRETADDDDGLPSCKKARPGLYTAVKWYASLNLAYYVFMYLNFFGINQVLQVMMNRGLLHTRNAAPKGALEQNTDTVDVNEAMLRDSPSCSVCLEEFTTSSRKVVRTKACKHTFHKKCLQGWLNVSRTCPLCRLDLGSVSD